MAVHRAIVVANVDPDDRGRLRVRLPGAEDELWASRVYPIAAFTAHDVPVGAEVWVAFEDDDAARPVVLGLVDRPGRRDALGRDLEVLGDAWDRGYAAGTTDAAGTGAAGAGAAGTTDASAGPTPNPYR